MRGKPKRDGRAGGQASVELVVLVPVIVLLLLLAVQLAAAGWALWAAGDAARAGARAEHVGIGDPRAVARRAVPDPLRARARVEDGAVVVAVRVPRLIPGLGRVEVRGASRLDPEAG